MSLKDTKIIDLNLFSGSSELLRQAVGGFYYDSGNGAIEFETPSITSPFQIVNSDTTAIDSNTESIMPRFKFATRIYADTASEITSDEDWRSFVVGGDFGDKTYAGIYNENVYADHFNTSSLPLLPRETVNTDTQPSLELTTEYYNHYPRYQDTVGNNESITQIPNFYLLASGTYLVPEYNTEIVQSKYQYTQLAEFLTSSYVNATNPVDTQRENIFVLNPNTLEENNGIRLDTEDLLEYGSFDNDLSSLYSLMPFGNKFHIEDDLATTRSDFKSLFETNYRVKFIKLLKEIFQGESRLTPSAASFAVNTQSEISTGTAYGNIQDTSTVSVNIVDVPTMLLYAYRNPTSETDNITVFDSGSYSSEMDFAFDSTGIYRYENTENSLSILNDVIEEVKNKFTSKLEEQQAGGLDYFLREANSSKYHETVAFRIEKIGGGPTGDSNTENTIQNIWFYNSGDAITYLDTQVAYNTDYTYKIYKYDIVQGYKYQLSDVVVTRQIATEGEGVEKVYCLEFYDPFSRQTSPTLIPQASDSALLSLSSSISSQIADIERQIELIFFGLENIYDRYIIDFTRPVGGTSGTSRGTDYVDPLSGARAEPLFYFLFEDFYQTIFGIPPRDSKLLNQDLESNENYFLKVSNYIAKRIAGDLGEESSDITTIIDKFEILNMKAIIDNVSTQFFEALNKIVVDFIEDRILNDYQEIRRRREVTVGMRRQLQEIEAQLFEISSLATNAQINSSYPYISDFNITIEPSLKIIEIPLEEKRMRIVDHPPNDLVITPHHLLDQSNRLAFYCKYDTFSMEAVTYPPTLTATDEENKDAYLVGHDFLETSEQTQESVSPARFIEVYRTTTKPTGYANFTGNLRKTIDLRQTNGDIPTDHLFVERVRENTKYYYAFRAVNENGVAGQMSPVFESELINDGGYVYGDFTQYSEEDLVVPSPKEPILGFKKLINIMPNIQHLQLDTSAATFASSSVSQLSQIALGTDAEDSLWDANKYFKIRLTSKKTGKKIDLNIGFKKEERN